MLEFIFYWFLAVLLIAVAVKAGEQYMAISKKTNNLYRAGSPLHRASIRLLQSQRRYDYDEEEDLYDNPNASVNVSLMNVSPTQSLIASNMVHPVISRSITESTESSRASTSYYSFSPAPAEIRGSPCLVDADDDSPSAIGSSNDEPPSIEDKPTERRGSKSSFV